MACSTPMMSLKEENTNENFDPNQMPTGTTTGLHGITPVTGGTTTSTDAENNNTPGIEKLAQLVFQQLAQNTQSGAQNQGEKIYLFLPKNWRENALFCRESFLFFLSRKFSFFVEKKSFFMLRKNILSKNS